MLEATEIDRGAKRLGRPSRVTAEQIAGAALEVGLQRATIRNVARHLGMSVPGLYHHVRTRDDLLAMAAAHSLGELPLPADHGQDWTDWLMEYARFVYDALVAQPEIVGQILVGRSNTVRLAQHLERVLDVLTRHGFSVDDAYTAYAHLSSTVIGAASSEIGRRAATQREQPLLSDLARAAKALGAEAVPLVGQLVRMRHRAQTPDYFETVRLVVDGLAASRCS